MNNKHRIGDTLFGIFGFLAMTASICIAGHVYKAINGRVIGISQQIEEIELTPGSTGPQGEQGEPGLNGSDGSDGSQGPKGDTGETGPQGPKGEDGQDGLTPHIGANGNWWIGSTDTGVPATGAAGSNGSDGAKGDKGDKGDPGTNGSNGSDGAKGEDGQDGLTPYIGTNGNWWIGDTDTGVAAAGTKGDKGEPGSNGTNGAKGEDGEDGEDGADGKSAYELFLEHYPEYPGDESQWVIDLANGDLPKYFNYHNWGEPTVAREANEDQNGLKVYTCDTCGAHKYETSYWENPDLEYIEFGKFPQTKVTDENTVAAVKALTPEADGYVDYILNEFYVHDGDVYLVEPIVWEKLSETATGVRYISKDSIGATVFGDIEADSEENPQNVYDTSILFEYTNETIPSMAFTEAEFASLNEIEVPNDFYTTYRQYYDSYLNYGGEGILDERYLCGTTHEKLYSVSTEEAKNMSVAVRNTIESDFTYDHAGLTRNAFWNRTPSTGGVSGSGYVHHFSGYCTEDFGSNYVTTVDKVLGVRPVLEFPHEVAEPKLEDTPIYKYEFQNWNGSVLDYGFRMEGGTPVYSGDTPVKVVEDGFVYRFTGWDKAIEPLTDHIVYTAQFEFDHFDYSYGAYPTTLVTKASLITALNEITETDENGYIEYDGFMYLKYDSSVTTKKYKGVHYYRVEPIQWVDVVGNINARLTEYVIDQFDYASAVALGSDFSFVEKLWGYADNMVVNKMMFTKPSFTTYWANLPHTESNYLLDVEYDVQATDFAKAKGVTNAKYWTADGQAYVDGELDDTIDPTDATTGVRLLMSFYQKQS